MYHRIRTVTRQAALKNPLLAARPLVFLQRRRFICQMLHEYLGYFYDYGDIAGGGVYVLDQPGRSLQARDLIHGRLPKGNYTTLALSYDAKTIYFAFCRAGRGEAELLFARAAMLPPVRHGRRRRATSASSPTARTTTSIPARCPTAGWPSCPRGAAASAAATTPGSRSRPTRCTAWTPD